MADTKTPAQIAQEYLTNLAVLRPDADTQSVDTDWFIRAQVVGGVVSGAYEDLSLLEDDIFPQSARHDAIGRHLFTYFPAPNNTFKAATPAQGPVLFSGPIGQTLQTSAIFQYGPNGNQYQPISAVTLTAATGIVQVQSTVPGQSQNLQQNAILNFTNPPAGFGATGQVFGAPLAGGTDSESDLAAANRVLARLQSPPAGGTAADYKNYSIAVPGVVDANVIRFIFGLGTVGVIVTSGTTDIDAAINAGQPIIRQPSAQLLAAVQTALEAQVPETDCVFVLPPGEVNVDATVNIQFSQGDQNTVPPGQTLTQGQLVVREVQRAIFKTPPGGRMLGGSGFVVTSDIEQVLADNLGNTPYAQGAIVQILSDWEVQALSATGNNRLILPSQLADPGNITLVFV